LTRKLSVSCAFFVRFTRAWGYALASTGRPVPATSVSLHRGTAASLQRTCSENVPHAENRRAAVQPRAMFGGQATSRAIPSKDSGAASADRRRRQRPGARMQALSDDDLKAMTGS
jgi:hypothetical protein